MKTLLALLLTTGAAYAECTPMPDRTDVLDAVYGRLSDARNDMEARAINGELWEIWLDAPDEVAQAMLDRGMALREGFDYLGAIAALDELIAYCPDFPEAYNQRAFAAFLARDFERALADLDVVLQSQPRHLGALSGKALTLIEMGRRDEAIAPLQAALALNPFMSERFLLDELLGEKI